jgi:hypothetical protein
MNHKILLAKILGLSPEERIIEALLSDTESGEHLQSLLDKIIQLRKKISEITKEIKEKCRLTPDAWEPVIEKAILTETRGNEVAAKKTRERKNQIKAAVKIAIRDGMRPSDIQAVIEVMVMGMQPGDTSYLLSEEDDEDKGKLVTKIEAPPKPEKKKEKQKSPDQSFLKTSI